MSFDIFHNYGYSKTKAQLLPDLIDYMGSDVEMVLNSRSVFFDFGFRIRFYREGN